MKTIQSIKELTTKLTECEYDRLQLQEQLLKYVIKNTKFKYNDKAEAFTQLRKINLRQLELLKVS